MSIDMIGAISSRNGGRRETQTREGTHADVVARTQGTRGWLYRVVHVLVGDGRLREDETSDFLLRSTDDIKRSFIIRDLQFNLEL